MPEILWFFLLGIAGGFGLGSFVADWRIARERAQWMAFIEAGTFEKSKAERIRPPTAEERVDRAAKALTTFSKQTVKTGVKELAEMYRAEGLPVPKKAQLEQEAELMLNAGWQGDGSIEV